MAKKTNSSSRNFKIRLELNTLNYVSPILEIEAKDWEEVCEEIFGKLTIIDTEEDKNDEELSCSKCGKLLTKDEYNDYEGMCATCWHERN